MFAKLVVVLCALGAALAFKQGAPRFEMPSMNKVVGAVMAGVLASSALTMPAEAISRAEIKSLSYGQIKGSGLANRCPVTEGKDSISGGKLKITELCIEPTSWQVEEVAQDKKGNMRKEFVNTKLMTRQTYTLEGISGTMEGNPLTFKEEDGIDYAATTVQMPGGERVPFLFTVKDLVAKGNGGEIKPGFEMGGPFTVPSYRTGLFLDPKGRGTTTGYDFAGALPGLQNGVEGVGQEALFEENNKRFDVLQGDIEFQVTAVNKAEGEFSGVFVSKQPGDTDMGGKTPKSLLIKGQFFARAE
jgi:photosystem II oxygen-evolving enhancer protein 1